MFGKKICSALAVVACSSWASTALSQVTDAAYFDCGSETKEALSGTCRQLTIGKVDVTIIEDLQLLLKFDAQQYEDDDVYRRRIDMAKLAINSMLDPKFETQDRYQVFYALGLDLGAGDQQQFLKRIMAFPASNAGCNFTEDLLGSTKFSRSFLISHETKGVQKFTAIHFKIEKPERVHATRVSERLPQIVSIDVYPLVPGTRNSNHVLRTHILKNPSVVCERIIEKMDADIIDVLRSS